MKAQAFAQRGIEGAANRPYQLISRVIDGRHSRLTGTGGIAYAAESCNEATMITRDRMFLPMLEAHPDFSTLWDNFVAEFKPHAKNPPYYNLIADIVRECSTMLTNEQTDRVRKILCVVERWLLEGDPYVREVATIGFIEDLQNCNLHDGTTPEDFVQFLGRESSFWWTKVERFWSHREPIVDDRKFNV